MMYSLISGQCLATIFPPPPPGHLEFPHLSKLLECSFHFPFAQKEEE
jgi:hypothetical protein